MTRHAAEAHGTLTREETNFLDRARSLFRGNADWLEFEDFAFGPRSPLFSRERSHRDVLAHPLYLALKEMWLELGVRQGRVSVGRNAEGTDAPRRKTRGRR